MVISASSTGRYLQVDPDDPPFGSGLRKAGLWILLSVGLFLILALVTYNPQDPSWSYASSNNSEVQNVGGIVGAWCADILIHLFGYLAFLFPFTLIWCVLLAFYLNNRKASSSIHTLLSRWFGFTVTLVAGVMLAELYISVQFNLPTPSGPGGMLGRLLTPLLLSAITPLGGILALVLALLVGLTLLLSFPWLGLMEVLGAVILIPLWALLWILLWPFRWLFARKTKEPAEEDLVPAPMAELSDLLLLQPQKPEVSIDQEVSKIQSDQNVAANAATVSPSDIQENVAIAGTSNEN